MRCLFVAWCCCIHKPKDKSISYTHSLALGARDTAAAHFSCILRRFFSSRCYNNFRRKTNSVLAWPGDGCRGSGVSNDAFLFFLSSSTNTRPSSGNETKTTKKVKKKKTAIKPGACFSGNKWHGRCCNSNVTRKKSGGLDDGSLRSGSLFRYIFSSLVHGSKISIYKQEQKEKKTNPSLGNI